TSPGVMATDTMSLMTITTFSLGGDLTINRLGFGAMRLASGTFDGPARAPETGVAVLRRAVELGVNHIYTAGFYRRGSVQANELIRTALAPYPDDWSSRPRSARCSDPRACRPTRRLPSSYVNWSRPICKHSGWTASTSSTCASAG